jgi:hypothetical protein
MTQQFAGVVPNGLFKFVGSNLFVMAYSFAAEAIRVSTDASVIRITNFAFGGTSAELFAIVRIATRIAFQKPLQ